MSRFDFWTQRLAEVMKDAALTKNPEHRIVYLDLAEHYTLMARICAKKPLNPRWDEAYHDRGARVSRGTN